MTAGDRVYSDFLLNFNNVAQLNGAPLKLNSIPANTKKVGLIIEAVDYMLKDGEEYNTDAATYSSNGSYVGHNTTEITSFITGATATLSGTAKSEFDATSLDNKNCIQ